MPGVRFPQDIQIILRSDGPKYGNLYISNIEAAQNRLLLQNYKIGAILTCAKGFSLNHPTDIVRHSKYIPLEEKQDQDIYQFLDEAVDFIADKLLITNVLIHCVAGVSRSACIVIAYLIRERKLSFDDAFHEVKSRRKIIFPNLYFLEQLKRYQRQVFSRTQRKNKFNYSIRPEFNKSKSMNKWQSFSRSNILGEVDLSRGQDDIMDLKSHKSHKSGVKSSIKPNMSYIPFKCQKTQLNPQQSYISKRDCKSAKSGTRKQTESKSMRKKSQIIEKMSAASSVSQKKKKQEVEKEYFQKKLSNLDERNNLLNEKLNLLQQRFETQKKIEKMNFEAEIEDIQNSITLTEQSQRKSKLTGRAKSIRQSFVEPKILDEMKTPNIHINNMRFIPQSEINGYLY